MTRWESRTQESIGRMLNPSSIAVVGATERSQYGARFFRSVMEAAKHVRVYPVNPRYRELLGVKCYPAISNLPERPDLVGIIVPYDQVIPVLEECAQAGADSAIIISAGFAERGDEERSQLQQQIGDFARQSGLRVCGPNCLGMANVRSGIWATAFTPNRNLRPGPIALVSHSGATAFGPLMYRAVEMSIGYSHIISTGNEADLESSDYIQYFIKDPEVRVIACFIEGFKDGRKFLEVAREALEQDKRLVLIKVGRSQAGSRAALSHTAALTGSDAVHQAAFRQYGVVRAEDYDDLLQTAHLLAYSPAPSKEGVVVVSHSGGIGSLMADHLGREGLHLPPLTEAARGSLGKTLGGFGWAANPADVTVFANRDEFSQILKLLEQEPEAGALVVATFGASVQAQQVIELRRRSSKPIVFLSTGGEDVAPGLAQLREAQVPLYRSPRRLARGLRGLYDYHRRRAVWLKLGRASRSARPSVSVQPQVPAGKRILTEHEAKELLSHWGIPATREVRVNSEDEALEASASVGFPLALKLESPHIPHKTEAGVVRLNVRNKTQLRKAYREVVSKGLSHSPALEGDPILVQEMVTGGTEVIVGLSQDPHFGPVVLFGLGGTFVEVFNDVAMRICPIAERDAWEMVWEVKGSRLLQGFRGQLEGDVKALVEVLLAVSDLALDLSHRQPELDINPLTVLPKGKGVKAVDALISLGA